MPNPDVNNNPSIKIQLIKSWIAHLKIFHQRIHFIFQNTVTLLYKLRNLIGSALMLRSRSTRSSHRSCIRINLRLQIRQITRNNPVTSQRTNHTVRLIMYQLAALQRNRITHLFQLTRAEINFTLQSQILNIARVSKHRTGIFTISSSEKISAIEIYNTLGEKVFQSNIQSPTSNINLSDKPKGIYFLKLQSGTQIYTQKVIIE